VRVTGTGFEIIEISIFIICVCGVMGAKNLAHIELILIDNEKIAIKSTLLWLLF
jgi:hypothetical protein